MKYAKPLLALLLAAAPAGFSLHAATPVWDTGTTAGVQATSGTWNYSGTANWTVNGGTSRVPWTSNADTASFQLTGAQGVVTIDNANGQVGAAGLVFSGSIGSASNVWTATGGTLQLGSGGLVNRISDGVLLVAGPLELTGAQTWSSTRLTANNATAGVRANGAISTLSGVTNLTFDGRSLANATSVLNALTRVTFSLGGNNTFAGSTTVTGGAALRLDYTVSGGNKLDDSRALVLGGAAIVLNGGSGVIEEVGSTLVAAGANSIFAGPSGGGGTTNKIDLGVVTHGLAGTLDLTSSSAIALTDSTNTNGILGGWATVGGNRFVTVNSGTMASTAGTTSNIYADWGALVNTVITNAVAGTGDKTTNTLRVAAGGSLALTSGTLRLGAGGMIVESGASISGGALTSGLTSGELFVHTPNAFTISSTIVNNGPTATALVKSGTGTLTVNGAANHTGGTFVNAGTLLVGGSGSLGGSVTVQGGATLDVSANGFTVASTRSLSGGGTVLGNITVASGGSLAPGVTFLDDQSAARDITATLTLGNNLSLNDGSTISLALGTNQDLIVLSNAGAVLTGSAAAFGITLNLSNAGGLALQTYTLMQWQTGTSLVNFDLSDFNVATSGGISGTLQFGTNSLEYVVSAVPEPSTAAMMIAGLMGTVAMARRRRVR